jgi:serine/threonine protein kinase
MKKIVLLILLPLLLSAISINYGELGTPNLEISASVSPYQIEKGDSGTLKITISEVGGVDWAKDVVVEPYSDIGISISPSESSPVDIDKYGSATFTFDVKVGKDVSEGEKTIYVKVDYIDTGWMDIGEDYESKISTTTFKVIESQSNDNGYTSTPSTYYYDSKGYISVNSNVAAEVYIDGIYIGTTPITDYSVDSGNHIISVEKEGYDSNSKTIYVKSGKYYDINIPLSKSKAYLNIYSSPQDAKVYVDGHYEGTTPLYLTLTSGTHSIEVSKDDYYSYTNSFTLYSGDSKTISAELTPKFGYLTVYSLDGADVYIDENYAGHPPIIEYKLSIGNHNIKVNKNDYNAYSTDVYINSGDSKTISAELTPKFGYLAVYSYLGIPCDVYIDNKWIGSTPLSKYKISSGAHNIECKIGELPIYESSLHMDNGATKNIDVNITNSYAGYYLGGLLALITVGGLTGIIILRKKRKHNNTANNESDIISNSEKPNNIKNKPEMQNIQDFPSVLLNKYVPLAKLGEGGFAKVFKVKRKNDNKIIALKISNLDEKAKKLFIKEISAWKQLNHPNIVKLYNAYEEPIPHLEIELVEGIELNGKTINELSNYPKPMDEKTALDIIRGISKGLLHAHTKNIIHRDLKPNNILLSSGLIPKITDWGLAKIGTKSTTATTTKGLTLLYAAPEQLDEDMYGKTDKRTDIYQLGLIFYEFLTGKIPYDGTSPSIISMKVINPDLKPKPVSHYDKNLAKYDCIFEKLLAKKKEDRFQSVEEFLNSLNTLIELEKERAQLRESMEKTKTTMTKTTNKDELRKLQSKMVKQLCKNAILNAELNDKVELLNVLDDLNAIIKREDNKKELEGAIKHVEYLIKESIPLGRDTIDKLKVLINRIEKEWE